MASAASVGFKDPFKELRQCPVCQGEILDDATFAPCKHSFHKFCIEPWLEQKKTCPTCRKPLTLEQLVDAPDYLSFSPLMDLALQVAPFETVVKIVEPLRQLKKDADDTTSNRMLNTAQNALDRLFAHQTIRANEEGLTPLHIAAQKGDMEQAKALLAENVPINIPTSTLTEDGDFTCTTPLMLAARKGDMTMIKFLLDNHALIDVVSKEKGHSFRTCLDDAFEGEHFDCLNLLLAKLEEEKKYDMLANVKLATFVYIISHHLINVCATDDDGYDLLQNMVMLAPKEYIKAILENYPEIDLNKSYSKEATLLHLLADIMTNKHITENQKQRWQEIFDFLVERGADINIKNAKGHTPLDILHGPLHD